MTSEEKVPKGSAFCRGVSDLSTIDGRPVRLGDVLVLPGPFQSLAEINRTIAGYIDQAEAFLDGYWFTNPPQEVTILVSIQESLLNPWESSIPAVFNDFTRFMLIVQLMQLTSCRPLFDVVGPRQQPREFEPWLHVFGPLEQRPSICARQAQVDESHEPQFASLESMLGIIEKREAERTGRSERSAESRVVRTVWQIATGYFVQSHTELDWHRNLVDLTTGLEAGLSDGDPPKDNISLRLCQRAAALLATDRDRPRAIYRDLRTLYELRSSVVHGVDLRRSRLDKLVARLSTSPTGSTWALGKDIALDRIRDLLRRTLLARLCLAGGGAVQWNYGERVVIDGKEIGIDELLTDEVYRRDLRGYWQGKMSKLGCERAFEPADEPQGAS